MDVDPAETRLQDAVDKMSMSIDASPFDLLLPVTERFPDFAQRFISDYEGWAEIRHGRLQRCCRSLSQPMKGQKLLSERMREFLGEPDPFLNPETADPLALEARDQHVAESSAEEIVNTYISQLKHRWRDDTRSRRQQYACMRVCKETYLRLHPGRRAAMCARPCTTTSS